MAANLTRLNVALTLTTGAFASGIVSAQKQVEGFGARLAASLNPLASLSGMLSTGALLYGFKATADRMRDLANASASLGITTEKLAGLRWAADQSGASAEQLDKALGKLQVRVAQAAAGNDAAAQAFQGMGLSLSKLSSMSADQKFAAIADAIAKMPDPAQRASAAVAVFGEEGAKLLPILSRGADGIKQMTDQARQLGAVVGDETTQALARASESMDRIMTRASGVGARIAAHYAPAIEAIERLILAEEEEARVEERMVSVRKKLWDDANNAALSHEERMKAAAVLADRDAVISKARLELAAEGMARVKAEHAERARLAAEQEAAWVRLKAGWDSLAPSVKLYSDAVSVALNNGKLYADMFNNIKTSQVTMAAESAAASAAAWSQYFDSLISFEQEFVSRVTASRMEKIDADIQARSNAWAIYYQNQFQFETEMAQRIQDSRRDAAATEGQERADKWAKFYDMDMFAERARQDGIAAEESRGYMERIRNGENYYKVVEEMDKQAAATKEKIWSANLDASASIMGSMASMMDKSNKKQFQMWQGLMIGQAIASTASAVIRQYAELPLYAAIPASIAVAAAGAAQIANIAQAKYDSNGSASASSSVSGINVSDSGGGSAAPENRQTVLVQGDYLTPETMQRIFADARERGIIIDGVRRA